VSTRRDGFAGDFPGMSIVWALLAMVAVGWPWMVWNAHDHPWGMLVLGVVWDGLIAAAIVLAIADRVAGRKGR